MVPYKKVKICLMILFGLLTPAGYWVTPIIIVEINKKTNSSPSLSILKIQIPDVPACKVLRRTPAAPDLQMSYNPDFRMAAYQQKADSRFSELTGISDQLQTVINFIKSIETDLMISSINFIDLQRLP